LSHTGKLKESLDHIAAAVRSGGIITLANATNGGLTARSTTGVKLLGKKSPAISLHSLSINLPRLAYESNKDEVYFRAKLALMIKPAMAALGMRNKTISDHVKKSILPTISACTHSFERGTSSTVVNLTGTRESVHDILGHDGQSGVDVLHKVLKT